MPDCEMIAKCLFFNDKLADKPGTAEMMKNRYCRGDFKECARYVVCKALGREKVPADMFPIHMDKAQAMIK